MANKNIAIVGGSVVVLVAVVAAVAVTISVNKNNQHDSSSSGAAGSGSEPHFGTTSRFIEKMCQPTDFKETCESTLDKAGPNVTSPKDVVKLAFQITTEHLLGVLNHSSMLSDSAKDPRTAEALKNCRELVDYAMDDLKQAFLQVDSLDMSEITKLVDDLKVWLSAAITYEETCLDGFEGTTTDAGASMRKAMNVSMQLTRNALAMTDSIGESLGLLAGLASRRLLAADGYPSWLSGERRKLLQATPVDMKPNIVVAQDGSGDVKTINEAVNRIPLKSDVPFVIYVKEGVYAEQVTIERNMNNVVMIGDGPTKTKITGRLNFAEAVPTFKTATLAIVGNGFIGKNFGAENTAGAEGHQAVAIRVQSDQSVFYNCQFDGYQDTLYAHTKRQFYRECTISGTIDFIFGNSPTIFQNCLILVRKPMSNQQNIVTAQGRKDRREPTAIILHNCTISADATLEPYKTQFRTYLARPWKEYSRTFFIQSQIDDLIHPDGFLPWAGELGLNTLFYAEVDNRGPGADKSKRVTWKGIKEIDLSHAEKFTVGQYLRGNSWISQTGVPFTAGLLPASGAAN